MLNLLLFLLAVACFGIAGAWMAENPGEAVIVWFGWRIETSFAFLLFTASAAALSLTLLALLIGKLAHAPRRFAERQAAKRQGYGIGEVTRAIAALAAGDLDQAERHARKAGKLLGQGPLTLLLSAQIARSRGEEDKTRRLLERLLDHPETEYLAARSLSDAASKQQLFPRALDLARRAHALNARDQAGIHAVVSLHVRLHQWQEALALLDGDARRSGMTRPEKARLKGLVHFAQARRLLHEERGESAILHARAALKYLPGFAPAAVLAARAWEAQQQHGKAVRLVMKAWKRGPHPELATAFRTLIAHLPERRRLKLAGKIDASSLEMSSAGWVCAACLSPTPHFEAHCPACGGFGTLEWR